MSTGLTRADSGYRDRPVVAALAILHSIELVAIFGAAMLVAKLGRAGLGRGAGLLALLLGRGCGAGGLASCYGAGEC
jgi:hypothetical protein